MVAYFRHTISGLLGLFLLAVCSASDNGCMPSQWEGTEFHYTATTDEHMPIFIQETGRFSYDANNSRIAAYTTGTEGDRQYQRDFIFLYDKRAVYIMEDGQCRGEKLTTGYPSVCIPRDFNWNFNIWSSIYGFRPDKTIYVIGFTGHRQDLYYKLQLDGYTWRPFMQQIIGQIGDAPYFQTSQYVNVSGGIQDSDVFNLPTSCQHVELKGYFKTPPSLYGMFIA